MSYAATVSQLVLAGYDVRFIDFDDSLQIDLTQLDKAVEYLIKYEHKVPDLVVIPSVYGNMPDMDRIAKLCKKYQISLIEDSAESFGCVQNEKYSGSFGIAGCFSFFANKIITSGGEGGAIVTNDNEFAQKCRSFINQGVLRGYYHDSVGSNFRITNIQAAIGLAQMEEYPKIVQSKKFVADFYRDNLDKKFIPIIPNCDSTEWMSVFKFPDEITYPNFADYMMSKGIETRPIFHPLNRMAAFWGVTSTLFPKFTGHNIDKKYFILPASPSLELEQLEKIVEAVNNYK